MSKLEALLRASIEIAQKNKRIAQLEEENASLRRVIEGDVEFELSADGPFLPPPFQRQAE